MRSIIVENVTKSFASRKVVDNISFEVNQGDIHGFLGPNGAGKTTSMRMIANLLRPDSGRIEVGGVVNSFSTNLASNQLGFLLEYPPLYKEMTVLEYLKFVGGLRRVKPNTLKKNIDYCIETLDLDQVIKRSIENLSKGFKQRVGIAQALVHMPKILILDEPTVGLDPQSVIEIRNLILNLKNEHSIILSSHLLHEMSLVCDQVTIISEGTVLESGSISDLRYKLAGKLNIELRTMRQTQSFDDFLKTLPGLISLESEKLHLGYLYTIVHDGKEDLRENLLQQAIALNTGPYGLEQREFTLEEIFMKITADAK